MTLGDKIKKYRELAGLNQDEVYTKIPISRATYSKWENNQADISIKNLKKLSQILDIPIGELTGKYSENLTPEINIAKEPPVPYTVYKSHLEDKNEIIRLLKEKLAIYEKQK